MYNLLDEVAGRCRFFCLIDCQFSFSCKTRANFMSSSSSEVGPDPFDWLTFPPSPIFKGAFIDPPDGIFAPANSSIFLLSSFKASSAGSSANGLSILLGASSNPTSCS
ncbi:hypothetical protein HanRHA438_Chr06g0278981 [Helianthus annuus]|nr:hypothetical protein HanRHA438_Chr06g0278981 [Helianthus annuus]